MIGLLGVVAIALVIIVVVRLFTRKKRPNALNMRDIGTIMDRSISAYRRHFVPALLFSTICVFLGTGSGGSGTLLANLNTWLTLFDDGTTSDFVQFATSFIVLFSALGIGSTLLAYGVALGLRAEQMGQPVSFMTLLPRQRIGAVIGLTALMIVPSLLGGLLGVIGALIALIWVAAPVVMVFEQLSPWGSMKRSVSLIRANYSGVLNTLVPLWLIGWLLFGTPLFAGVWLLQSLGIINESLVPQLLLASWLLGQIFVAPLVAFGATCSYLYIQEKSAAILPPELAPYQEPISTVI
jgi:hypothetical protein